MWPGRKQWGMRRVLAVLVLVGLVVVQVGDTHAQQIPSPDQLQNLTPEQFQQLQNLTPEQRQKLQQQRGMGQQPEPAQPLILTPAPQRTQAGPGTSELERIISGRIGHELRQFGYDQVGIGSSVTVPQTGAVQEGYVLGPGDEIEVSLRGQENSSFSVFVDRNGQITLPKLSPIAAAGRTLGEFREDLVAAVHRSYVATEAFVSIGQLRQVSVMVAGEVDNPGVRIVTGLSSPLDAILLSGGVKKSGSLRNIKLIRSGVEISIDLYSVLTQTGRARLINLRDGDRIFVPPIGATVAAAGSVRRPAIYELPDGQRIISVRDLLALASGPTVPGSYTDSILRLRPDGKLQFVDVSNEPAALVHDSEVLLLKAAVNISLGRVTLEGAARTPGAFALDRFPTLHDLLPSAEALEPGAYVLFGVIDRTDPQTLQRVAIPFSPLHVIQGRENLNLISDDAVHVLTRDGMRALVQTIVSPPPSGSIELRPGTTAETKPCKTQTTATGGETPSTGGSIMTNCLPTSSQETSLGQGPAQAGASVGGVAAGETDLGGYTSSDGAFFGRVLGDYRVNIAGAVHQPGLYLIAPNTTLAETVAAAGGLTNDVDLRSFELTSTVIDNTTGTATTKRNRYSATADQLARIVLQPFDELNFHHVYSDSEGGTVTVGGEVRYPGTYSVLRGERLSSVLKRAGGLTDVAYPYGTVFLRQSVAKMEQVGYARAVTEIRSQLFSSFTRPTPANSAPLSAETMVALQGLLTQLQDQPAIGRISVAADPTVLLAEPERDLILESGDSIVIPKRPSTISIQGEVLQPGSYLYNQNLTASDYLAKAGGYTALADSSLTYIILPDGSAEQLDQSWLPFDSRSIPPGSVIVVPRDIAPFRWNEFVTNASQIFSQLAIAGASLAVISTNTK